MERSTEVVTGPATRSLSDDITRLSDTIRASDRLSMLGVRTIVESAVPLTTKIENNPRPVVFLPSVSRDLQNIPAGEDIHHPTTCALCTSALQSLLPIVGRFEFGTHENKDIAFHPIERRSFDVFRPKTLSQRIREKIVVALEALQVTGDPASETLGNLHPLTAACVMRALAPSKGLFQPVFWRCIFVSLWFLNRRTSSTAGYPNIQETGSAGTAFLTSKCMDGLETLYSIIERRRARIQRLLELMKELHAAYEQQAHLESIKTDYFNSSDYCRGCELRQRNLIEDIRACLAEIDLDTAVQGLYRQWVDKLDQRYKKRNKSTPEKGENFLSEVIDSFLAAMTATNPPPLAVNLDAIESISREVRTIHETLQHRRKKTPGATTRIIASLPRWLCSADYWASTKMAMANAVPDWGNTEVNDRVLEKLEKHWLRHCDACEGAQATCAALARYFADTTGYFNKAAAEIVELRKQGGDTRAESERRRDKEIDIFLDHLSQAATKLSLLHQQLWKALDTGARWAEVLLNRHLAYYASGAVSRFDPCELAHAVRAVSRDGGKIRVGIILEALRIVCASQRVDGTWTAQQPFHWDEDGFSTSTLSVETAAAVVSTVYELLHSPDRFGASLDEISDGLQPVYDSIDRFFRWLSGTIQAIPIPPAFKNMDPDKEPALYGWCSERVFEPGRIHSWATASAIQFLVEFRRLLQERINLRLRAEFVSHHPAELDALAKVVPTDLAGLDWADDKQPAITRLKRYLRDHKQLEMIEGPWFPSDPPKPDIKFWSGIFYGPPGTSKTFMAQAIAGELNWPLISLSPSDFLARGDQHIESRAQEIFTALRAGSRIVYFFDEIEELIRDRNQSDKEASLFPFLTPSFLTKFQDLRDEAKRNEYIFIVGTNYFDRIDSAAKRSGRFDQNFLVVYPDLPSRRAIAIQHLLDVLGSKEYEKSRQFFADLVENSSVPEPLRALQNYLSALHKQSPSATSQKDRALDRPFFEACCEYSGLLSFKKLQELNLLLTKLTIDPPNGYEAATTDEQRSAARNEYANALSLAIVQIIDELCNYNSGIWERFKPEIEFVEYFRRRPGALDEISRVARVLPESDFCPHVGDDDRSKIARRKVLGELIAIFLKDDASHEAGAKLAAEFRIP
jgi:broad-specificity NMP kinase